VFFAINFDLLSDQLFRCLQAGGDSRCKRTKGYDQEDVIGRRHHGSMREDSPPSRAYCVANECWVDDGSHQVSILELETSSFWVTDLDLIGFMMLDMILLSA
jgi:hypothetical protein